MSKQVSFLHAADLHLDSPFNGLTHVPKHIFNDIRESTFVALDRLVSTAIHKKVDFILLVGDLFDNEKQSLKAQVRLKRAFEKLQKYHIDVFLSYGNHDYINGNIYPVEYPNNVHIFSSEDIQTFVYTKNEQDLAIIYGFSYENRAVLENKVSEFNGPIQKESLSPFHIAMLHGSIETNTTHDRHAPFQLKELVDKNMDYWALGHIHQRDILHEDPFVIYPGNIQGRHRKETGEKGCYHVVLSQSKTELSFVQLDAIEFRSLTIDVTACQTLHQLETMIQKELKEQCRVSKPLLIDLTLTSQHSFLSRWNMNQDLEEIVDIINDSLSNQADWTYIYQVKVRITQLNDELLKSDFFMGELSRQIQMESIQPYIQALFKHKQGRKHVLPFSAEEEEQIRQEAKQLLINELLMDGGDSSEH